MLANFFYWGNYLQGCLAMYTVHFCSRIFSNYSNDFGYSQISNTRIRVQLKMAVFWVFEFGYSSSRQNHSNTYSSRAFKHNCSSQSSWWRWYDNDKRQVLRRFEFEFLSNSCYISSFLPHVAQEAQLLFHADFLLLWRAPSYAAHYATQRNLTERPNDPLSWTPAQPVLLVCLRRNICHSGACSFHSQWRVFCTGYALGGLINCRCAFRFSQCVIKLPQNADW